MKEQHTLLITLVVNVEEGKYTPCERVQALLDNGTIREAFSDAGMEIVSAQASEPES